MSDWHKFNNPVKGEQQNLNYYRELYKQQWISVKDRLPENNGRYLVNCIVGDDNYINIYVYHGGIADNCGWIKNATVRKDVTHWMPLPDGPESYAAAPPAGE